MASAAPPSVALHNGKRWYERVFRSNLQFFFCARSSNSHNTFTDRQTDRETDLLTDRQTDRHGLMQWIANYFVPRRGHEVS